MNSMGHFINFRFFFFLKKTNRNHIIQNNKFSYLFTEIDNRLA